jgi:inner membrane protein involved in colicin E2 resistance
MTALGHVAYILSNLVIAVMLGCMLQSAWENSSTGFRMMVSLLAAAAVSAFLLGGRLDMQDLVDLVEILKSLLLAVVLVMMRLRQIAAGQHTHSKQRAAAERSESGRRREPTGAIGA